MNAMTRFAFLFLWILSAQFCFAVDNDQVVHAKMGIFKGTTEGKVSAWLGIPYAQAPKGNLRFRAPQPIQHWEGIADAKKFGPSSPQFKGPLFEDLEENENCLFLNVWSPAADGKKRPVMFWIHGGGFISGSASSPLYNGAEMAAKGDLVIVTINYRLGPLGFLYFGDIPAAKGEFENNLGIKDQIAALKWVRDNIEFFGGDPDAITIFGESAGAISVQTLMAIPEAKGMFKRAIVESGNPEILWTPKLATDITNRYLAILHITPDHISTLKTLPVDSLVSAMHALMKELIKEPKIMKLFAPTVDGEFIPRSLYSCISAGECQNVDLLIGTNKEEANLFAMKKLKLAPTSEKELQPYLTMLTDSVKLRLLSSYEQYPRKSGILSLLTDATFAVPSIRYAEAQASHANTYMYRFDWSSKPLRAIGLRACHGIELPFVFGTFNTGLGKKVLFLANKKDIMRISESIQQAWINFAKTGNPNAPSVGTWKKYDATERCTMMFDKNICTQNDPKSKERKAWDGVKVFQQ